MSEPKKKFRQYSVEYLKYGFISSPGNSSLPMCLLCNKTLSNDSMKPSKLKEHLIKIHSDKKDKDLTFFQTVKEKYLKTPSLQQLIGTTSTRDDDGLRASYNISLLIAKSGKPHTIGEELILPAITEVIRTVLHRPAFDIIKRIPLSNNTVQRRIDEMAQCVENSLCEYLKTCEFSIQLDESTLPGNEALLLAYVRFVKEEKFCQELLFGKCLETDTKGETLFTELKRFFDVKAIPLTNIISVATDGAPAMVGRYRGFLAYLKQAVPNVFSVHCVIHRHHLVAKNLSQRLHGSLDYVIRAVNKIKRNALNERLFAQLCLENDEDYNRLLLHTEVRWLSKSACLNRFYALFDTVLEFLESKDNGLRHNLINSKNDIAYMTDLFGKFNETNLKLQGDQLNLIKTKSVMSAFVAKLLLYKQNLGRGDCSQFPNLSKLQNRDEDMLAYCQHLTALHADLNQRFEDILHLNVPDWVLNPFARGQTQSHAESIEIQEQLIEISTNEELKPMFQQGYHKFWLQKQIPIFYPALWVTVQKLLTAFPSSYLVERGFSAVMNLITKKRNRLEISARGDLRLLLTNIEPDINILIKSHHVHPSH